MNVWQESNVPPRKTEAPVVAVDVEDRQLDHAVDVDHLCGLFSATLADQTNGNFSRGEVGLAFVGVDEMGELNQQYMGGTGATDVLAFPIDGVAASNVPEDQPTMLGDVVVCPEVASRAPQALNDELALLVVHGALHLLGHDHAEPDETERMKALELAMLDRFHRR